MANYGTIGFVNGLVVYKHNSDIQFNEKVNRIYELNESEELGFNIKLRINKPTSFVKIYFPQIEGILKHATLRLEFLFTIENGIIIPQGYKDSEKEVIIYELTDGSFICTYKQEFNGDYKHKYKVKITFKTFQELELVNGFYRGGIMNFFDEDKVEEFFAKSKLNKE